jgi:hypothetical protein
VHAQQQQQLVRDVYRAARMYFCHCAGFRLLPALLLLLLLLHLQKAYMI